MSGTSASAPAALKVDEFVDVTKIAADVAIDEANLNEEFVRQSGLIFHYIAQHARAEAQLASLKLRKDAVDAQIATNVRSRALADSEKLTVDMVKDRVRVHPTSLRYAQAIIKAEEVVGVIRAACDGMRHKKDMLVTKGHMTRDEMKANALIQGGSMAGDLRERDRLMKDRLGSRSAEQD